MHVLVDYLTFTDKGHSRDFWVERLGLTGIRFTLAKPRYMWTEHLYYEGVHIYTSDTGDCGVELSGTGCRLLETLNHNFDWFTLASELQDDASAHISRLDIACDDRDGILDFKKLYRHVKGRKYISRARRVIWTDGDEQQVVFGSPQSDTRLRIYNKAMERGLEDEHWIRAEFQLRNDQAESFVMNWMKQGSLAKTFAGVLLYYLRFTTSAPDKNRNNSRIDTVSWWDAFLGECEQLPGIFTGGLEYNQERLDKALKMCLSTVATFVRSQGGDLTRLVELISYAEINPRQQEFLDNLERDHDNNNSLSGKPARKGGGGQYAL